MGPAALRVVAASLVLAATPMPSASAAAPPAQPSERVTFGVQPSGPAKPDRRSELSYSATPGATLTDHIAVSNYAAKPLTLRVYASDAFTTRDGGFDLLPGSTKPVGVGAWVGVRRRVVTVPGRGTVVVPFRLAVPASAAPGDHSGGIVAALETSRVDGKGNRVALEERVGARIHVRVAGPLDPKLAITSLSARYRRGTVTLTYAVRNAGNVRLRGRQRARVTGWLGGPASAAVPDLPELLPGSTAVRSVTVRNVRPGIRLAAEIAIDPVGAPGATLPALPAVTRSVRLWAVPWLPIAVAVAGLGSLVAGGWWRRRRTPARGRHAAAPKRAPRARATAGAAAVALLWPGPAYAGTVGSVAIDPPRGADNSVLTLTTSGPCPDGANIIARVFGRGFPAEGQTVVSNSPISAYDRTPAGGLVVPLAMTLRDFVNLQDEPAPLSGTYRFVVTCRDNVRTPSLGDFAGSLRFTAPRAYVAAVPPPPTAAPGGAAAPATPGGAAASSPASGAASVPGLPGSPGAALPGGAAPPAAATPEARASAESRGGSPSLPILPLLAAAPVGAALLLIARRKVKTRVA